MRAFMLPTQSRRRLAIQVRRRRLIPVPSMLTTDSPIIP